MELRDRLANLALFAAAALAWLAVAWIVTTRDPVADPSIRIPGAIAMGIALGVTVVPLAWLVVFARHRRIAYRGDWYRAARRGGWVCAVSALLVLLRLQGAFSLPIAAFVIVMVLFAEVTLSVER